MSLDEERRRLERAAQDDLVLAGRLASMNRRLGEGMRLIPIVVSSRYPNRSIHEPPQARAWLLVGPPRAIMDERLDVTWRNAIEPSTVEFERGEIVVLDPLDFKVTVPEWFLDG